MLSAGRASSKIRFAACEPQGQSLHFFIDSHSPLDNSVSIGTDGALSSNHMDNGGWDVADLLDPQRMAAGPGGGLLGGYFAHGGHQRRAGIVLPDRFPVVKVPGRPTETLAPARCFSSYHKTMRLAIPLTEGLPFFEHLLEKPESLCGKGPANAEAFPFSLRSSHMPSVCPPRSFHGAPSEKN